jgi:hypothetical protein
MDPMTISWIATFARALPDGYVEDGTLGVFVKGGREYPEAEVIAFARAAAKTDAPLAYIQNRRNRSRAVFFDVPGGATRR